VVDAHMHVPRLSTVSPSWMQWAVDYGQDSGWQTVFDADGDPDPARLDALLDAEGVDAALLFAEYSPRATGIQPVEDLLPLIAHDPYFSIWSMADRLNADGTLQVTLGSVDLTGTNTSFAMITAEAFGLDNLSQVSVTSVDSDGAPCILKSAVDLAHLLQADDHLAQRLGEPLAQPLLLRQDRQMA